MQRSKTLIQFLKAMAEIVADEAERNPAFADKLDALMMPLPMVKLKTRKNKRHVQDVPDVYVELQQRGEEEFRFWLARLDLATLKSIVKVNGFDMTKTSRRWTEPDKFVTLITEQVRARLKRGSSFITSGGKDEPGGQSSGPDAVA